MKYIYFILILLCASVVTAETPYDRMVKAIDYALAQQTPTSLPNYEGVDRGKIIRELGKFDAVGFMPVITTLPQGAMLPAVSVIVSPDRRYVRIGVRPFFSTIGEVNTFNFGGR